MSFQKFKDENELHTKFKNINNILAKKKKKTKLQPQQIRPNYNMSFSTTNQPKF